MAKRIIDILDEVQTEICDKYCKYPNEEMNDEEYQKMLDEVCSNCPLNKL